MANPDFIEVQKYLSGMDYPATKSDIVAHARGQGAGEDVVQALEQIADREYDGPNAVSEEVAKG
jgi:Protein of unknown function (DUF2795)